MTNTRDQRTRRMAWWSLGLLLLSLAVPFVAMGLLDLHDRLDPPRPRTGAGFQIFPPRLVAYVLGTYFVFGAIQLTSMGCGIWVARQCRRVLWWLVPQLAIVCSLYGIVNSFFIANSLKGVGLVPRGSGDEAAIVIACVSVAGSLLGVGLWTWWVLTPQDSDWIDAPSKAHSEEGPPQ